MTSRDKRAWYLKKNYGMSIEAFELMLSGQGNRCANPGCRVLVQKRGWCVDHDHKSGKIRGILCFECNRLLGAAKDELGVLFGAATYLARHHQRERNVESA